MNDNETDYLSKTLSIWLKNDQRPDRIFDVTILKVLIFAMDLSRFNYF